MDPVCCWIRLAAAGIQLTALSQSFPSNGIEVSSSSIAALCSAERGGALTVANLVSGRLAHESWVEGVFLKSDINQNFFDKICSRFLSWLQQNSIVVVSHDTFCSDCRFSLWTRWRILILIPSKALTQMSLKLLEDNLSCWVKLSVPLRCFLQPIRLLSSPLLFWLSQVEQDLQVSHHSDHRSLWKHLVHGGHRHPRLPPHWYASRCFWWIGVQAVSVSNRTISELWPP